MREVAAKLIGSSAFVFFVTLVIHGFPVQVGDIMSGDGPYYSELADRILRGDWSSVLDSSRLLWTTTIFLTLVAGAKAVAPVSWPYLIVAMNVVCSAATAVMIVRFVRSATGSVAAAAAALLFYLGSFEGLYWTRFVMIDSLYTLLATAVFIMAARPILTGRRPGSVLPLVACLLLAVLTRQPGIVLVFLSALAAVAFWPRRDGHEPSLRRHRALWLVIVAVMVLGVALRTAIVHDPALWPFEFVRPKLVEFSGREKVGEVVAGQLRTFHEPPETHADHLAMQAARFVRFFQFATPEFSLRHNLVETVYFVPLYALGILGIANGFRTTDRRRRHLVILLLVWIVVFAYYHAVTILLWRYRLPIMPQFIILAALGVDALRRGSFFSRRAE